MAYKELKKEWQIFVDEYIINRLNATEAYRKAYPKPKKSDETLQAGASRLLRNGMVQQAIQERAKEVGDTPDNRIQDVQETLEQDTSIARGDIQVTEFKETDLLTDEVITHIKREFVPSLEEQGRARERIYKVNGSYLDRKQIDQTNRNIEINIGEWDED